MNHKMQTLPLGEPRSADVAELEKELSALWRSAAEDPSTRDAVTRACTLTLLVYVESEEEGQEVSHLISAVTQQNPCRAIVLVAAPQASPAGLSATISAHCHLPAPGAKQVCCEQIILTTRGDAVENLDNVVLPLLISGLPVHLWWRAGQFTPHPYLHQVLRVSSHLLLDSERFANSEAMLPKLAGEIRELDDTLVVTDINWARLTPWRELVAQCFDSVEARPYLENLSEVRIEYNRATPETPARRGRLLLLISWLASRLKWESMNHAGEPGSENRSFRFKSARGQVDVLMTAGQEDGSGPPVSLSLVAKSAEGTATFSLATAQARHSVATRFDLPGRSPVERIVHVHVPDEVELVNEELKVAVRDRIYEEALAMLERMMAA